MTTRSSAETEDGLTFLSDGDFPKEIRSVVRRHWNQCLLGKSDSFEWFQDYCKYCSQLGRKLSNSSMSVAALGELATMQALSVDVRSASPTDFTAPVVKSIEYVTGASDPINDGVFKVFDQIRKLVYPEAEQTRRGGSEQQDTVREFERVHPTPDLEIETQKGLPDESRFVDETVAALGRQQAELKLLLKERLGKFRDAAARVVKSGTNPELRKPVSDVLGEARNDIQGLADELDSEFQKLLGPDTGRFTFTFKRLTQVEQLEHVIELAGSSLPEAREILSTLLKDWSGLRFEKKEDSIAFTKALQGALKATHCRLLHDGQQCTITFQHSGRSNSFKLQQGKTTLASSPEFPRLALFKKKR